MRYLIDTNIFVYMASDLEYLSRDIDAIIQEPETLLYISAESVREDPSDHVIIAHAITEHLPLISSDTRFGFYRSQGLDLIFNQK